MKKNINILNIFTHLGIDKKIQDTIYFVVGDKIFPVKLLKQEYILKEGDNSHTENKIIKEKDKKDIVITDVYTHHYQYNLMKIKAILPDELIEQIKLNDQIRIRLYINDGAYDISINKFFTNKIRKVYSLENQYVSANQ